MSEHAPSVAAGDAAVDSPAGLTPAAIAEILQEFRGWLEQAADRAAGGEQPPAAAEPEFSWQALAGEFTALRQEVNLQTRAARAQLDQNAQSLQQLGDVVEKLEERAEQQGGEAEEHETEALRPLLKALVDAFDALSLARREVQRAQGTMEGLLARATASAPDEADEPSTDPGNPVAEPKRRWWQWWSAAETSKPAAKRLVRTLDQWCGPDEAAPGNSASAQRQSALEAKVAQQTRELAALQHAEASRCRAAEQARQVLASILVGYTMSLQRLERALAQHELEPIECLGEPFDPECMEVVEVVAQPGRSGTEVLEEVRRGYRWRGRLFRFAQVRVARP